MLLLRLIFSQLIWKKWLPRLWKSGARIKPTSLRSSPGHLQTARSYCGCCLRDSDCNPLDSTSWKGLHIPNRSSDPEYNRSTSSRISTQRWNFYWGFWTGFFIRLLSSCPPAAFIQIVSSLSRLPWVFGKRNSFRTFEVAQVCQPSHHSTNSGTRVSLFWENFCPLQMVERNFHLWQEPLKVQRVWGSAFKNGLFKFHILLWRRIMLHWKLVATSPSGSKDHIRCNENLLLWKGHDIESKKVSEQRRSWQRTPPGDEITSLNSTSSDSEL